jgi:hypothetical protein
VTTEALPEVRRSREIPGRAGPKREIRSAKIETEVRDSMVGEQIGQAWFDGSNAGKTLAGGFGWRVQRDWRRSGNGERLGLNTAGNAGRTGRSYSAGGLAESRNWKREIRNARRSFLVSENVPLVFGTTRLNNGRPIFREIFRCVMMNSHEREAHAVRFDPVFTPISSPCARNSRVLRPAACFGACARAERRAKRFGSGCRCRV